MITWNRVWNPRYGVLPGYGITMQNGFEDVFTANAMAALEFGALPYAQGLIENEYSNYIRYDGLINYRAEEVSQQARMLTILALYYTYRWVWLYVHQIVRKVGIWSYTMESQSMAPYHTYTYANYHFKS